MKNNLFSTSMVVLPILSAVQLFEQKVPNKPLNIVCIFTDDHAFQTISAYGHPISKLAPTPNIDRLAGNGMLLRNLCREFHFSSKPGDPFNGLV